MEEKNAHYRPGLGEEVFLCVILPVSAVDGAEAAGRGG